MNKLDNSQFEQLNKLNNFKLNSFWRILLHATFYRFIEAGRWHVLRNTSTVASCSDTLFWVYFQRFQQSYKQGPRHCEGVNNLHFGSISRVRNTLRKRLKLYMQKIVYFFENIFCFTSKVDYPVSSTLALPLHQVLPYADLKSSSLKQVEV